MFQAALVKRDFTEEFLQSQALALSTSAIEELHIIDETVESAAFTLMEAIPLLIDWSEKFLKDHPTTTVSLHRSDPGQKLTLSISKLLDIEEHVWSPLFGLKGNVDVTAEVALSENDGQVKNRIVPLELKTGKNTTSVSHRAQSTLYALAMSDKYDTTVGSSELFYLKTGEMLHIPTFRDEARGLILRRNELAGASH
ncbi:DNA replication factor Dna2-domain-containing protein [Zopfochytrium polystomum]|nr:DNA replication factor Dna2-domain-containing protein [Zopfochytrium polystomum]